MNSRDYWANRAAQDMVDHMGMAETAAHEIGKAAKASGKYLKDEIQKIFLAFKDLGISEREARTLLRSCRHGSVKSRLRKIGNKIKDPEKRKAFLDALNGAEAYDWRIRRIEQLNREIDQYCAAYRKMQRAAIKETLGNVAGSSYYHTIFNIQQETGLGFSFSTFSRAEVDAILRKNWSGANYSDRIWNNIARLARSLKDELLVSAMTGRSTEKTSRIIADKFGNSMYNARRLVRTESAYVEGAATDRGYEEAEIDDYIFVAVLDMKTSRKCAELDGKTFHRKDLKVGTNYPPMHPWCRSTTIASFGPDTLKGLERRARDKDGKLIKVPADMTYSEWAKKYCPEALEFESKYRKNTPEAIDKKEKRDIMKLKGTMSDEEARKWYVNQNKKIPSIINKNQPLEKQAEQACKLRNENRFIARELMKDQEKRKALDISDPIISFEELVAKKMRDKQMTREQALEDIIKTSTKSRKSVNKKFGLED